MPKSLNHKGLISTPDLPQRLLEHFGVQDNPIAHARVSERLIRGALERRSEIVVWIGRRQYVPEEPRVLDALADETGLLLPPVTTEPARAERASSPSVTEAAV